MTRCWPLTYPDLGILSATKGRTVVLLPALQLPNVISGHRVQTTHLETLYSWLGGADIGKTSREKSAWPTRCQRIHKRRADLAKLVVNCQSLHSFLLKQNVTVHRLSPHQDLPCKLASAVWHSWSSAGMQCLHAVHAIQLHTCSLRALGMDAQKRVVVL